MTSIAGALLPAFIAVFVENIVFSRAIGVSSLILIAKNRKYLMGFTVCIMYFSAFSGILAYIVKAIAGNNEYIYIYQPLLFLALLGLFYVVSLLSVWRLFHKLYKKIRRYIHLSTFNGAILGIMYINYQSGETLTDYIIRGAGLGLGFLLALYLTSVVYDRLFSDDAPYIFRGYPLLLIYLGILGMALYGL